MNKDRLPDQAMFVEDSRACSCRVQTCCCCVPLGLGAVTIAVFVFLEAIVAFLVKDWINLFLQCFLLLFFMLTLAKRFNQEVRRCLWLAYTLVLILNFIQLVAFTVVYLVLYDVIEEVCEEFAEDPPSDERLVFETVDECVYNVRMVTIAAVVTASLIYFPFKFHFMLVLRAYYKDKRDARENLIYQERMQRFKNDAMLQMQ